MVFIPYMKIVAGVESDPRFPGYDRGALPLGYPAKVFIVTGLPVSMIGDKETVWTKTQESEDRLNLLLKKVKFCISQSQETYV